MAKLLAIETSCDETAAAVVLIHSRGKNQKITALANIISSQIPLHQKTHGVVPEVAARAHLRKINNVVQQALKKARVSLADINHLAVTTGPGLATSLLVGSEYIKGLSLATGVQITPVNHMLGHLYSAFIKTPKMRLPSINLIVSGGHTYLVLLKDKKHFKVLGQTVDDAAGEAFDKAAKMLGLNYPGGPEIYTAAKDGKHDYNFPRPMISSKNFNFSFAGLKTALLYKIRDERLDLNKKQVRADLALSFQNAVIDVLISKTLNAAKKYKTKSITLSGGVAANIKLRTELTRGAKKIGTKVYVPDASLCTDNALMIANAAAIKLQNGFKPQPYNKIQINPTLPL